MNEERDCTAPTETNRNNEVIVGLGLFVWIRTERRPLDLGRRPLHPQAFHSGT